MDFKDAKTQKIALGIMAFFVVVYFWHSRLYTKYDQQIATQTQEFERITSELRAVEIKAKSLEALKVEYTDLLNRYDEIEALLPEVKQIPSFLVQLHTASSLTGTKITSIQPLDIGSEEFYNVASFEISMTGAYHDIGSFVSYVANFPFIANIDNLQLTALEVAISSAAAAEAKSGEKKNETVSAVFSLSTYFVKDGERLTELTI
ncbi:MAG: type 4a pilus biogenesis protein PilO [candidate division Zixibacteria bacterium]|nr:type 4a pilus biogenesis protein PilO [candidate division Zixibacteria bacterium]MDH3939141.1 type 4a pilus biogenesis protein PilO [candidate division Zixibacteria bacterium]MDH4034019.1 type 4a pilus biogenesis protein PilO [candidate division Zixibacteria bacterium]